MTNLEETPGPAASPEAAQRWLPALLLLFIGSGCAALIYEVVWFQLLQLNIGSSAVSLGVLLGVYMGGMCLGSLLLPKYLNPRHHPLRVYAYLELGIAVFGVIVLFAVPVVGRIYTSIAGTGQVSLVLRAIVASICLLPPTLLMGATLPAIARWVETTPRGVSWLGYFYGGNLAGAVVGSLLAGFYLLRVFDMPTATAAAVALNVVVALVALAIAARTPHTVITATADAPSVAAAPLEVSRLVYIAIALSGLTALGSEVVWTRMLSLLFGATTYTFSLILAVFLVGLGIGSSLGSAMARNLSNPRIALGWCQLGSVRVPGLGCVRHQRFATVLAHQSLDLDLAHVQFPARSDARDLGDAARRDPLGRKLPAGVGWRCGARTGFRTSRGRRLRRQHRGRDRGRGGGEPGSCGHSRQSEDTAGAHWRRRNGGLLMLMPATGEKRTPLTSTPVVVIGIALDRGPAGSLRRAHSVAARRLRPVCGDVGGTERDGVRR